MTFKAVLFDLEGTLVDFQWRLKDAQQEILAALQKAGIDPDIFGENPDYARLFNKATDIAKTWDSERSENLFQTLEPIYDRYDQDALSRWQIYPETRTTLQTLSDKGLRMGVVSNCGTAGASGVLEKYSLSDYFELIISRNDVRYIKPAADGLELAARQLDLLVKDILFVGDSTNDIEAANRIAMPSCFLKGGESKITGIISSSETYTISRLFEVTHIC